MDTQIACVKSMAQNTIETTGQKPETLLQNILVRM